jgi:C1A family cysteine protease
MQSHKIHRYGWRKDRTDGRDKVMTFGAPNLLGVPTRSDLRENCSPVEDQSTLGSCTANATVGDLEYLEIKDGVRPMTTNFEYFSRLFVYYNTRDLEGRATEDCGGTLRDAIKSAASFGACNETKWVYDVNKFTIKPSDECYADGATHKITEYHRLDSFPDMIKCLADGYPFVFGFMVYDEFESVSVATTGVLNLPAATEQFQGGHAVCGVGYDMDKKIIIVRNSWGKEWGMDGYFTMPFDYIKNPDLAQDFWTIRR